MKHPKSLSTALILCATLAIFFTLIFYTDNKYETPPPYGESGVLTLSESHFSRNLPLYLIDGWLLSDNRVENLPTYIGEFSNLQRGDYTAMPHGDATYQLTLHYTGKPIIAAIEFPELFSRYSIQLDNKRLTRGAGNGDCSFLLTQGYHALTVKTASKLGYYSGIYYPPALGTPDTILRINRLRSFFYALAFLLPLSLALFTLLLWRTGGSLVRCFGVLCCCYSLYVSYYFVQQFHLALFQYWFLIENLSFYGLCYCVIQLSALSSNSKKNLLLLRILFILSSILLTLCLLPPSIPWVVVVHGKLTDLYYLFTFSCIVFFGVRGVLQHSWEYRYILAGCIVFGVGMILNLFASNQFEPIRFFWQFEWCGLFLVLLFGAMMVARNRRILEENNQLTHHLEQSVIKRTEELTQLLTERKAFFSDMAHDLKAPVFATQSFIVAIREGGVGIDSELSHLLDQAEQKQREMARRLQGLSTINALDKIQGEKVTMSIQGILKEVYTAHHGETEVASVHLIVQPPETDGFLMAQPDKLEILFENLVYNALKATPSEGSITVCAVIEQEMALLTVADTGCGIAENELPYIFKRFYVGQKNKETGTGLGLYIVKTIVEELGGTISVSSIVGEGTIFTMKIPLAKP